MGIRFQTVQANCVLVLPRLIPGVINDPGVLKATGGAASQVIQLPDVAIATFPGGIQINYLEVQPQRFNLTVTELGELAPTPRWEKIAQAACKAAYPQQSPIAFGLNFVRTGVVEEGAAGDHLRKLLNPDLAGRTARKGMQVSAAGIKLFYPSPPWRVTLSVEPDPENPLRIVASSNFHVDHPERPEVRRYLSQYRQAYDSFVAALATVLLEGEDAGA